MHIGETKDIYTIGVHLRKKKGSVLVSYQGFSGKKHYFKRKCINNVFSNDIG